jgi:hypothetical protein
LFFGSESLRDSVTGRHQNENQDNKRRAPASR